MVNSSGKSTGFRYELKNFLPEYQDQINQILGRSKINMRVSKLIDLGVNIVFDSVTSTTYETNLKMIDTSLYTIIGELLLNAYSQNTKIIKDAILSEDFEQYYTNIGLNKESIKYKLQNFLNISAIGMTPSKIWNGNHDVDGGIIVVKSNGDLLGYFVFSLNKFKEYLWQNTYFETPSTSRHDFGYVYSNQGKYYFDLNLQVRFR